MLSIFGQGTRLCDGITRREILRIGGLGFAGLTLADVLRLRASAGNDARRGKTVIMIWLRGGPSHIDSYDMKPEAPAEIRGEFRPIRTNVAGIQICEYMPRQAGIMDKLAIVRGIKSNDLGDHTPHYILTGFPTRGIRPTFGAVTSYLQRRTDGMPPYVSTFDTSYPSSTYTGPAHRPFIPRGAGLANLSLARGISRDRLGTRRQILREFDSLQREVEYNQAFAGYDGYTARALEMVTSPRVRDAFDLSREPQALRDRYGAEPHEIRRRYGSFGEKFLLARRLAEAGVSVVTLKIGDWDTHERNFRDMRDQLPYLDRAFHALVTDIHDRGLQNDVAVVMWGEFGRAPRISRGDGRDHWPEAGAAVIAGGGFRTGQVIGDTDSRSARARGRPYTPSHVLANLYWHLGIDTATTIPDHNGRPRYVLDEREPVRELGRE